MNHHPLQTSQGLVDLNDLPPMAMAATVLGTTLAKINRYAGRTAEPWSVAAHSVLVSRLCRQPQNAAWALLHDAHEAFIGDIISPSVKFIASQSQPMGAQIVQNCVRLAKEKLDGQIRRAWGVHWDTRVQAEVDYADRLALHAEMFVFFGAPPEENFGEDLDRAVDLIRCLPNSSNWQAAATLWVSEAERLAYLTGCQFPNHPTTTAA